MMVCQIELNEFENEWENMESPDSSKKDISEFKKVVAILSSYISNPTPLPGNRVVL